jgi:hypothetical protein
MLTPTDTAEGLPPDDLDSLLEESLTLVSARKAKASGRKLTQEQAEALAANAAAEEIEIWDTEECFAVVAHVYCQCGSDHEEFRGWFHLQSRVRGGKAQRLIRKEEHEGVPSSCYRTRESSIWCPDCLRAEALPDALEVSDCDMLGELGAEDFASGCEGTIPDRDDGSEPERAPSVEEEIAAMLAGQNYPTTTLEEPSHGTTTQGHPAD